MTSFITSVHPERKNTGSLTATVTQNPDSYITLNPLSISFYFHVKSKKLTRNYFHLLFLKSFSKICKGHFFLFLKKPQAGISSLKDYTQCKVISLSYYCIT